MAVDERWPDLKTSCLESELQAEEHIGYTIFVVVDGRVAAGRSFAPV